MASQDKRLELVEQELKLVKGEIKRTLVDLRALVMKEGSPFQDSGSARASRPSPQANPTQETIVTNVSAPEPPRSQPEPQQAAATGAAPSGPMPMPMPMPMQPPVMGQMAPPAGYPAPAPGYPPAMAGPAMAGPMSDWGAPAQSPPEPMAPPSANGSNGVSAWTHHEEEAPWEESGHEDRDRPRARNGRAQYRDRDVRKRNEGDSQENPGVARSRRANGWHKEPSDAPRERFSNAQRNQRNHVNDRKEHQYAPHEEDDSEFALPEMQETDEALDVNLIGSLMHWVATALDSLGPERLDTLLDLYLRSGHRSPGLRQMVARLVKMHGDLPDKERMDLLGYSPAQRCNDLLLQLHGILSAHCSAPYIRSVDWSEHDSDRDDPPPW